MGKLYDSLLSGTSGRTGRIVVANVHGNEITRIRPKKRSSAPSQKQQLVMLRMKKSAEFMQSYKSFAMAHFGKRIGLSSSYNQAMTNLLENSELDYANNAIIVHYPNIQFAKGPLLGIIPTAISLPSPTNLKIDWQDNSAADPLRESDWLQVLIAAHDQPQTAFFQNIAQRNQATHTLVVPSNFVGKTLHIWLAFTSSDQNTVSNSVYAGSIV